MPPKSKWPVTCHQPPPIKQWPQILMEEVAYHNAATTSINYALQLAA